MAINPLVSQGTLNRLRASITWPDFSSLNVTAPFLGKEAITLALQGEATTYINTLTGAVTSPEPYLAVEMGVNLLKSQPLADAYKQQMESSSLLGNCTVRPDATPLSPYSLVNCSIRAVRELHFNGEDAGYVVMIGGYYLINSSLYNT